MIGVNCRFGDIGGRLCSFDGVHLDPTRWGRDSILMGVSDLSRIRPAVIEIAIVISYVQVKDRVQDGTGRVYQFVVQC